MVEHERISGSLPSRGRRPPDARSVSMAGSERERDREEKDLDRRRRARSGRSGERTSAGHDAGIPAVGPGTGTVGALVGSDSAKWFAGYPDAASSQGAHAERWRRSKGSASASTGGGTGASPRTSSSASASGES